jgi:hypothetical protein
MSSLYDFLNTELSSSATGGVNTAEGQDPSTVNDGLRQFKQLVAAFIDDLGAVTTVGGTADAITVTLGQVGGANSISAYATGQLFRFKAGADNTGAATINVNAIGAKAIRKIESGADVALDAADILDGKYYLAIYDATANAAAGAWIIDPGSASVAAATTTAAGIVELATLAETLAYTDATRAVTPSNLPLPTGYLYGLTLANGTDATNDINIAAGSARDASDSYNFLLASTYVKQIDAAWALGSAAGGLDTGSVGNSRYAIWGIGRSDTRVCDVLFSTSFSSPTMPANYDFKVLIGEFTRTGGVNGTPLWYGPRRAATGYVGITLGSPTASTSGTSIDFTGIPAWAKRITVGWAGVSLSGTSNPIVQIGTGGSPETSSYLGAVQFGTTSANHSSGFTVSNSTAGTSTYNGMAILSLIDASTNTWAYMGIFGRSDNSTTYYGGGQKSLAGVLDMVRFTTAGGTDTFDAGKINITWE